MNSLHRCRLRRYRDSDGIAEEVARQTRHIARHGSREQQRLPFSREGHEDTAHIANETHVEHAVCLVENEMLDSAEVDATLSHQVQQAPGRGNEDVDATRQRADLGCLADAAEDHCKPQLQMGAIGAELVVDLDRQFPCRRENEGAWCADANAAVRAGEPVQDRQREGRRLAGAGLGDGEYVPSGQNLRDGLRLDRRRGRVFARRQRTLQGLGQAEFGKQLFCHIDP